MAIGSAATGVLNSLGGGGGLGRLVLYLSADGAALVRELDRVQARAELSAASLGRIATSIAAAFTGAFVAAGAIAVKEFAKWESSFADVRKTVDGTTADLNRLATELRKMATELPVNVNEINKVAAAAGQLGIKTENIKDFTKVMLDMGITTKLSAEQAAEQMARFANITQMPQTAFDQLGSTISKLDMDTVAAADEILNMGLRIAGAGTEIGVSRTQILGLAAALSSIGIHAELGGTAVSQVFIRMSKAVNQGGEELQAFADLSRMTTQEFSKAFVENAGEAFLKFIQGIKKNTEEGKDVFNMLSKLHTDGVRVLQTIIGISNAGNILADTMGIAKKAWNENEALARMAQMRYETFAARIQITANLLRELAIQIGESLSPTLLQFNSLLQQSLVDSQGWGQWFKGVLIDYIIPGVLTGIGLIGDAIQGWKIIFAGIKVALSVVLEGLLDMVRIWVETIGKLWMGALNTVIFLANKAVDSINKVLPKSKELSKIDVKFEVDTSMLEGMVDVFHEMREEATKDLNDAAGAETFSTRMLGNYDKLLQGVKDKNKEIVKDSKKTIEDVAAVHFNPNSIASNQATNVLDSIEMPGYTYRRNKKGMGGSRFVGMLGPGLRQFEDQNTTQAMEIRNELAQAKEKLKVLEDINKQELSLTDAQQKKKLELLEAYQQKIRELHSAEARFVLGTSSQMFEDLATIAETWGGKQNAVYMAMFAASKAFAIAESIVKIQQGIANAAAMPWPANLAAIASVVAATANIVSTIQSTTLQLNGERAFGGSVSKGGAYMVGERGRELFVPNSYGTVVPNDRIGGGTNVVVNNYTDAKVSVRERQDGDQKTVELVVQRVKNEIGSEIREGRGIVSRSMESSYNLRRGR